MIPRFVNGAPASFSRVKTKADLKQVVKELNEGGEDMDVQLHDPLEIGSGLINLRDFFAHWPLHTLQMTNHPKRTWYASVSFNAASGKVVVK